MKIKYYSFNGTALKRRYLNFNVCIYLYNMKNNCEMHIKYRDNYCG